MYYFRPIIPLTISYALGIILGITFPGYELTVIMLVAISSLILVNAIIHTLDGKFSPLLLFLLLGYLAIQNWTTPHLSAHHILNYANFEKHIIEGVVDDIPIYNTNRLLVRVKTEFLIKEGVALPVTGSVRFTVFGKKLPSLKRKDRIRFKGKIRPFRNFYNPGGFDYERYMAFKEMKASTYAKAQDIVFLSSGTRTLWEQLIDHCRKRVSRAIDSAPYLKGDERDATAFLKGIILGDKTGLSKELKEKFHKTGTGHILAISGLHIGIVSAFSYYLLSQIFSRVSWLLVHGLAFRAAAIVSLLPAVTYATIAGMSASTQRAFVMVTVFMLTFLTGRRRDLINTLFVAAFIILLIYPPFLYAVSFQFSFMAVLFILLGLSVLYAGKKVDVELDLLHTFLKRAKAFLWVSFMAGLGVLPLSMYYFNLVSYSGLLVNAIIVPIIGFFILPLSFIGAVLSLFSHFLGTLCFSVAGFISNVVLTTISAISAIPYSYAKTISPSLLEITLFYLVCLTLFHFKKVPHRKWLLCLFCAVLLVDVGFWCQKRFLLSNLRATAIDVGQGSSTLVETPGGKVILVDGGGFSNNDYFDMGKNVLAPFLWKKKIRTVDLMILTHPNSDHLNGLIYIVDHFNVKEIWTNNDSRNTLGYQQFIQSIDRRNLHVPEFETLRRHLSLGDVDIDILYPPKDFLKQIVPGERRGKNDYSLVIKMKYKDISLLFPGDITKKAESALTVLNPAAALESSVLFAPHHGSKTSSSFPFLLKVAPKIIVVSAGWHNRFGFPHKEVMNRYHHLGAKILRTDQCGAISIITDGTFLSTRTVLKGAHCP